jgi:hypothetical protein
MKAVCDIEIEFDDPKLVKTVLKAVEVDNFDFVKSKPSDNKLNAHIESKSVSSLLHTLDDYLACISVAAKVVDKD